MQEPSRHVVRLAGRTRVHLPDGRVVDRFGGGRSRQILEILAVYHGVPVSKERLADLLWEGRPPASVVSTLEGYVCLLRRSLGPDAPVRTTTHGYLLDPQRCTVAVHDALRDLDVASKGPSSVSVAAVRRATALLDQPLLAQSEGALWADELRRTVQSRLVAGCTAAARAALAVGDAATALDLARLGVRADRLAEEAWEVLLLALVGLGRAAAAMTTYNELREVLSEELGTSPGPGPHTAYLQALAAMSEQDRRADHSEIRLLMDLLRDALSRVPGVTVPTQDGDLSAVAASVIAAA